MLIFKDQYEIISQIGEGNYGTVYLVRDKLEKIETVVKIIEINQFTYHEGYWAEAEIHTTLNNKYIVKVRKSLLCKFPDNNGVTTYLIDMEYVQGESLEKKLNCNWLSIHDSTKIISDVLYGLEYLHKNKILHRDIKPSNIIIQTDSSTKLLDFGQAINQNKPNDAKCFGYAPYIAPEVINGNNYSELSDIYAVGLTMYRCINNIQYWEEFVGHPTSMIEWSTRIQEKVINYYQPYVPSILKRIIKKCCDKDQSKRYQKISELHDDIIKNRKNIHWNQINTNEWFGKKINKKNTDDFYFYIEKGNMFSVILNQNKRKKHTMSKEFEYMKDAEYYMNHIISKTWYYNSKNKSIL